MTAPSMLARLDAALRRSGQTVILRRPGTPNVDATMLAHVTDLRAEPLTESIRQADFRVILSPALIDAADWPAASLPTPGASQRDQRLPRKGDQVIANGQVLSAVADAKPFFRDDVLVRIELMVRG